MPGLCKGDSVQRALAKASAGRAGSAGSSRGTMRSWTDPPLLLQTAAPHLRAGMGKEPSSVVPGREVVGTRPGSVPGSGRLCRGPAGARRRGELGFTLQQGFSRARSPISLRNCAKTKRETTGGPTAESLAGECTCRSGHQEGTWSPSALPRPHGFSCQAQGQEIPVRRHGEKVKN